jgi:hypothetical protein
VAVYAVVRERGRRGGEVEMKGRGLCFVSEKQKEVDAAVWFFLNILNPNR